MRTYIPDNFVYIPEEAKKVFSGQIFDVYQWPQKMFDGSIKTFEMLSRPDSVQIIAVHEDHILVCKEQQPHTEVFLDIPAGMHDHREEDELAAAKRELAEETGYRFNDWRLVHAKQVSKKLDQIVYTFLATDLINIGEQKLDIGEKIEVLRYTFDEFLRLKHDPIARSYPSSVMEGVKTLEDLLAIPILHRY